MRVADRARLLLELHEIRRRLTEAAQRVDRLSSSVKHAHEPEPQVDRDAS